MCTRDSFSGSQPMSLLSYPSTCIICSWKKDIPATREPNNCRICQNFSSRNWEYLSPVWHHYSGRSARQLVEDQLHQTPSNAGKTAIHLYLNRYIKQVCVCLLYLQNFQHPHHAKAEKILINWHWTMHDNTQYQRDHFTAKEVQQWAHGHENPGSCHVSQHPESTSLRQR